MTTSIYNQRRRRSLRRLKRAEKRAMRRTEGDWKFPQESRLRPNRMRDTWDSR